MLIKKSVLTLLLCFALFIPGFTQIVDSVIYEFKTDGVWHTNALDIATRDEACDLVSILHMQWNEVSKSWIKSFRSDYTDNPSKNNSVSIGKSWEPVNKKWTNSSKSTLTSYNGGSKEVYIFSLWNAVSNSWVNNTRITQYFDSKGRVVENDFEVYLNNKWEKEQRGLRSYDPNDRVIESIFQVWTNNAWTNNSKSTYNYTNDGMSFDSLWSIPGNTWVRFRKIFNKYLGNTGIPLQSRGQIITDSGWQNAYLDKYKHNSNNQMLSDLGYHWDANGQVWINSLKITHDYYADGDFNHYQYESWDVNTQSWNSGSKMTNTDISCSPGLQFAAAREATNKTGMLVQSNNGNYLLRNALKPKNNADNGVQRTFNLLPGNSNTIVYNFTSKDNGTQAYELIFSSRTKPKAISSNATASAVATSKSNFILSPNPAKNYFTINLSSYKGAGDITLKLSDVMGKLILQQKMNAGMQKVNLPSLQQGIYLVTIISGKNIQSQKLAIE